MAKKKSTKKKPRRKKPEEPKSKGFGHLTIPDDVRVRDSAWVDGGEKDIDSMECWTGYDWEDRTTPRRLP